MTDRQPSKAELLEHYARGPVRAFRQIDGFIKSPFDPRVPRDDDWDGVVMASRTYELMSGYPTVRVLIPDDAEWGDVVLVLKKMLGWVEADPAALGILDGTS